MWVFFDWDRIYTWFLIGTTSNKVEKANSLRALIASFRGEPGVNFVGEGTWESYDLGERKAVHDMAMADGHHWWATPNRLTYSWRNRIGWEKGNENDCRILRIISEYPGSLASIRSYKTQGHVKSVDGRDRFVYDPLPLNYFDGKLVGSNHSRLRPIFHVPDPLDQAIEDAETREVFKARQADAMEFRRLDKKVQAPRLVAFKRAVLSAKGLDVPKTIQGTKDLWKETFPLLRDGAAWAVAFAAAESSNRDEFDALLGAHAHGAKSMMRSQFYHHGWLGNGKGPMTQEGVTLSAYRKQARQLGSLVHKHGITL